MTTLRNSLSAFESAILSNHDMLVIKGGLLGPGDVSDTMDSDQPNIIK